MRKRPCALCGVTPARWNEPGTARQPSAMGFQLRVLEERVAELERGDVTLGGLRRKLLSMCAMCQELMLDLDRPELEPELVERLKYRIELLRRQVSVPLTGTDGQ
jgi:hypothetical protein